MARHKKKTLDKIKKELKQDRLLVKEILIVVFVCLLLSVSVWYVYTNQKHSISFNSNGGNVIVTRKIKHNKSLGKCDIPTKEGYDFIGWYYNEELFDCNKKITEDIELEAKWQKKTEGLITSIEFLYADIKVKPNTQLKLIPLIEPKNTNEILYWSSSNTEVAEVNSDGVVTFKKTGTVEITVSTDNDVKATQLITVDSNAIEVEKIILSETKLTLDEGSIKKMNYILEPLNASNKNVKWMSDDTSILMVDQNGEIVAKKAGKAVVILATMDGKITAKCEVEVIGN